MSGGVTITGLEFGYGSNSVLREIDLKIESGELFALLGPSGSGKTTLLRLIAGFGTPRAGTISIGERDVGRTPPWKRNIGMVFQSYALWPHRTVRGNVAFGLEERRVARAEITRRVDAVLALVGLEQFAERRPAQLSGGQQQRVALARALVIEPDLLLLDEPLSNLDAALRVQVRGELRALQQSLGVTMIYVTHDQEEANTIADRVAVMDQGRIQQIGTPRDLYDHPANRFVAGFLGTVNLLPVNAAPIVVPMSTTTFAVRPQAILLDEAPEGALLLDGTVRGAEFLGATERIYVTTSAGDLAIDRPHQRDRATPASGSTTRLAIPYDALVPLSD